MHEYSGAIWFHNYSVNVRLDHLVSAMTLHEFQQQLHTNII